MCCKNFCKCWFGGFLINICGLLFFVIWFLLIKISCEVIFLVKLILWVMIIIVIFFLVRFCIIFSILWCSFGLRVEVGLLNSIIFGFIVSVWVIVICCC